MNDAERLELPHVIDDDPRHNEIREHGYYDRSGNNISFRDWLRISVWDEKNDFAYKRVARTTVGPYLISTVWLGLNHRFGPGRPLIFETMVFNESFDPPPSFAEMQAGRDDPDWEYPEYTSSTDLDCERYATEAEALAGHERMVEKVRLIHEATSERRTE